jgi:DNA replication protein DnaC
VGALAGHKVPAQCPCEIAAEVTDLAAARERRRSEDAGSEMAVVERINPIMPRYANATLSSVDRFNAEAVSRAQQFVQDMIATPSGQGVAAFGMFGKRGSGKTYIGYGIVRALRAARIPAMIYTFSQIDRAIKATFGHDDKTAELFERLVTAPLLVIDDIGKEHTRDGSSWSDSQFYDIVDERYLRMLPILVTSNFDPQELELVRYAKADRSLAVIDRLHEMFSCEWLNVAGESRRV